MKEAGNVASCETNADCRVHRVVLCNFKELDCHAAHVNKARDTAALDKAIKTYAERCPVSKCKCDVPSRSVCTQGRCAAE